MKLKQDDSIIFAAIQLFQFEFSFKVKTYAMHHRIIVYFFLALIPCSLMGQITKEEYIETYREIAMKEMERTGIPASIKLGQAILESNFGNSDLARKARNHFGIKCRPEWKGKTYYQDDDERDECFRRYSKVEDSYLDHSDFLKRSRYEALFELDPLDYKGWAFGLKKAGYATNPKYAELLIRVIEENQLYRYDRGESEFLASEQSNEEVDDIEAEMDDFFERKKQESRRESPEEISVPQSSRRTIQYNNNIKYILVREGDTFESLTDELDMMAYQLPKYNERNQHDKLEPGSILYLQPKRNKASREFRSHVVQEGESLYSISQQYGIKQEKLRAMNQLGELQEPQVGSVLNLR